MRSHEHQASPGPITPTLRTIIDKTLAAARSAQQLGDNCSNLAASIDDLNHPTGGRRNKHLAQLATTLRNLADSSTQIWDCLGNEVVRMMSQTPTPPPRKPLKPY